MAQAAGNLIGTLATLSCQIIELSLNSKRYLEQMDVKTLNNIEKSPTTHKPGKSRGVDLICVVSPRHTK